MRPIAIGEVLGPHGMKGEVRVQPLTDFPHRFYELDWVYLGEERQPRMVQGVREHGGCFLVKLAGITNAQEAGALVGTYFLVPRHQLVKLPPGQFYLWEIEGLQVFTTGGAYLGVVEEVLTRPANDVYVVRDAQGTERLIPALRQVVVEVNLQSGRMLVAPGPSWEGEG